jgi:TRAP-type uncharacterized transport system substrate-binding protein
MKRTTWLLALLLAVPSLSHAQELKIADGSSSGTYQEMVKQIVKVCGNIVPISEVPASGAVENLDKVIGNEANAAFLHSDVIWNRNQRAPEDVANIKTLLALFKEDVHFVVLNKPFKEGGWKSMANSGTNLDSISDLKDLTVGAAGGGFITANVIRLQSEITYKVVSFDSGKEVLTALNNGTIAAAVFVGAAPLPNLKDLGKEYKILSISESTRDKLKSVYRPTTITYTKMSPTAVQSVAADSLLVAREYKTPKFRQALQSFRQCFYRNLDELKETPGTHKAWQQVDQNNHGKWAWYEFGNSK